MFFRYDENDLLGSGVSREGGFEALRFFTEKKNVYLSISGKWSI